MWRLSLQPPIILTTANVRWLDWSYDFICVRYYVAVSVPRVERSKVMTQVTVTRSPWIRHHLVTISQSSLLSVDVSRSCLPLWKLEIDRSSIFYYDLSASEATCDEEVTRPSFHHRCLWMWRLVTVFVTSRDTSAADSRSHGFNTRVVTRERIHKGLLMCMTVVLLTNCSDDIFLQTILIKHKKAFSQNNLV